MPGDAVTPRETDIVIRPEVLAMMPNTEVRQRIAQLEKDLRESGLPEIEYQMIHAFAPGLYGRQMIVPADTLIVTKLHKSCHLTFLMKGSVIILTEEGISHKTGPTMFVTKKGTKRVIYCKDEVHLATAHMTEATEVETAEEALYCASFEDWDAIDDPDVRKVLEAKGEVLCLPLR